MNASDRPSFQSLLSDVLGFYGKTTTPFAISVWWEACKGLELDAIRGAMTAHATDPQRGHFAPMPADVIRVIRGSVADQAGEGWASIVRQISGVGSYGKPVLDERQRDALDAIGGWAVLCRSEEDQLSFMQRRFVEAYQMSAAKEQRQAIAGPTALKLA